MQKIKVKVHDEKGLHLRPAARIVEKSKEYKSEVTVAKGERTAQGASVIELLLLGAGKNAELEISVSGDDEAAAAKGFADLFYDGGGI